MLLFKNNFFVNFILRIFVNMNYIGNIVGKVLVQNEWDDITFNMDANEIYYLGGTIPSTRERMIETIEDYISNGQFIIGIKPVKQLKKFTYG